jgi:hypothetical protein
MALFNRLIDEDFNQSHQANLINQLDCCGACSQVRHVSLVNVTKVHQEVPRKATGLALDSTTLTFSAEVGVENLFHAPHLAYAVVNASEGILGAQIEQSRKLVLYLRLRVLPNNTVVHDGESLFVRIRGSRRPKDALRRPSTCRLSRRM